MEKLVNFHPTATLLLQSNIKTLDNIRIENMLEYWMDNWTVSDVTEHAGITGRYLENAIISDKSK